jgi:hypothetical protein
LEQEAFRQEIKRRTRELLRQHPYQHRLDEYWINGDNMSNIDLTVHVDVAHMDHQVAGFMIEGPAPPPPLYKPSSPPPEGFRQMVAADNIVVCRNCDHKLGTVRE